MEISKDLLGKVIYTNIDGVVTAGKIVETEAYNGRYDKACHAYQKRTKRTEIMYGQGGHAYMYLCYGMYNLFNIVTNTEGLADAVLVRAVEPLEGIETMLQRRKLDKLQKRVSAGPGILSLALGLDKSHYGEDLLGNKVWLEDANFNYIDSEISATPRIGIDYAEEHIDLPWRFVVKGSEWVSK